MPDPDCDCDCDWGSDPGGPGKDWLWLCAGLCPNCGVDRNVESCSCETESSDPRWDALRELGGK